MVTEPGSPLPNYQLNSSGVCPGESVTLVKRRDRNTSLGLCMNVQGREEEEGGGIVNCVVIVINCDLITLSESPDSQ